MELKKRDCGVKIKLESLDAYYYTTKQVSNLHKN